MHGIQSCNRDPYWPILVYLLMRARLINASQQSNFCYQTAIIFKKSPSLAILLLLKEHPLISLLPGGWRSWSLQVDGIPLEKWRLPWQLHLAHQSLPHQSDQAAPDAPGVLRPTCADVGSAVCHTAYPSISCPSRASKLGYNYTTRYYFDVYDYHSQKWMIVDVDDVVIRMVTISSTIASVNNPMRIRAHPSGSCQGQPSAARSDEHPMGFTGLSAQRNRCP